jgi:hypothetical protein
MAENLGGLFSKNISCNSQRIITRYHGRNETLTRVRHSIFWSAGLMFLPGTHPAMTLKRSAQVFTCRQIDRFWGFHTNCVPENINAGGNLTGSRKLNPLTCYLTLSFSKVGQGNKWPRPNPDFSFPRDHCYITHCISAFLCGWCFDFF